MHQHGPGKPRNQEVPVAEPPLAFKPPLQQKAASPASITCMPLRPRLVTHFSGRPVPKATEDESIIQIAPITQGCPLCNQRRRRRPQRLVIVLRQSALVAHRLIPDQNLPLDALRHVLARHDDG